MSNASHLTTNLGGAWHGCYGTAPCPVCQPQKRKDQNALTIATRDGRLLLHCKKLSCDFGRILTAAGIMPSAIEIDQIALGNADRARFKHAAKLKINAQCLWDNAAPIDGTHAEGYLRGRGITCTVPKTLRWLSDAYHGPSGTKCGAMIARIAPTDGIHRTFFNKNGKRLLKSAKMMLGPCSGGAVWLSGLTKGPLVVCEGLETGLSLLSGLLDGPHVVWAALSTSGMKGLTLPRHSGDLILATDGDAAGRKAGNVLAHSAKRQGWNVSLLPAPDGLDWNDVLQERIQT